MNKDQVLVAQILKLINSGFYSLRREVKNINHAVNLLGVNKLKELLL
ncbi:MAG: HDOD domain-containing protein, partial [Clostridia bacterium]|nr:HDOD domain-containing protein [Clostridia bacterium]